MTHYGTYIVCKEHLHEVQEFLKKFFEEVSGKYNFAKWISFKIPHNEFIINLMPGEEDQALTQNMTLELYCESKEELKKLANKHKVTIKDFIATSAPQKYKYHYIEIFGPNDICKIEASFTEDIP